jgi:hypothetical protein
VDSRNAQVTEVNRNDFRVTFRKLLGNSQIDQGVALPSSEATIVSPVSRLVLSRELASVALNPTKATQVLYLGSRGSNGAARRLY